MLACEEVEPERRGRVPADVSPGPMCPHSTMAPGPGGAASWSYKHDGFARVTEASGLQGEVEAKYVYHALSLDSYDASEVVSAKPTYSTVRANGHGWTVEWDQRTADAGGTTGTGVDTLTTVATYQATGEMTSVVRSSKNQTAKYTRWMQYDSLGRMVLNAEPNTSSGFTPTPGTPGFTRTRLGRTSGTARRGILFHTRFRPTTCRLSTPSLPTRSEPTRPETL